MNKFFLVILKLNVITTYYLLCLNKDCITCHNWLLLCWLRQKKAKTLILQLIHISGFFSFLSHFYIFQSQISNQFFLFCPDLRRSTFRFYFVVKSKMVINIKNEQHLIFLRLKENWFSLQILFEFLPWFHLMELPYRFYYYFHSFKPTKKSKF